MLNIDGRLTLTSSCLSNVPLDMISFYPILVGLRKKNVISLEPGWSTRMMITRKGIILLIGELFARPTNKVG